MPDQSSPTLPSRHHSLSLQPHFTACQPNPPPHQPAAAPPACPVCSPSPACRPGFCARMLSTGVMCVGAVWPGLESARYCCVVAQLLCTATLPGHSRPQLRLCPVTRPGLATPHQTSCHLRLSVTLYLHCRGVALAWPAPSLYSSEILCACSGAASPSQYTPAHPISRVHTTHHRIIHYQSPHYCAVHGEYVHQNI